MPDSAETSVKGSVQTRLKELIRNIQGFADDASEEEQQALLNLLEDQRLQTLLENRQYSERRTAARKPCSLSVHYAVKAQLLTDMAKNISSGGVFIETFEPLAVGQEITLTITPPNEEDPVETVGEIVWAGPRGVGVRFTTESEELEGIVEAL